MKLAIDPLFCNERERYSLRFTCEDCALFDATASRCAHGFPTAQHRKERYQGTEGDLLFCKEFQLK